MTYWSRFLSKLLCRQFDLIIMTSINITFRVDWQSTLLSGSTDSLHHFQGRLTVYITFRVTDKSMFAIRDCHVNALVKRFCMTVYSTFKTTEFYFSINLFSIYTLIFEEKKHVPGRLWPPMCIHSFSCSFRWLVVLAATFLLHYGSNWQFCWHFKEQ